MTWKKIIAHTGPGFQPHKHKNGPMHGETVTPEEEQEAKTLALGESEEPPLYVEYHKEKEGEVPVQFGGETYLPVWARYPGGKIDVGYYSQAGDVTYGYDALRNMHGIK